MTRSTAFPNSVHRGAPPRDQVLFPRWRSGLFSRRRLIERIHEGAQRKLTIVSAPAGFGKTTLLAEWLADAATAERAVEWVSLDRTENEPSLFWAYLIGALRRAHPAAGTHALSLLRPPQPPSMESVLTVLINEIDAIDSDFIPVLDDYHVILAALSMKGREDVRGFVEAFSRNDRYIAAHGAWMLRGYAIGMGAGTQVLAHLPWFILVGKSGELSRGMLMGVGWAINLVVAEWIIRKGPARPSTVPASAAFAAGGRPRRQAG